MAKQSKLLVILLAAALIVSGCGKNKVVQMKSGCVGVPIMESSGRFVGIHVGIRGSSGHEFWALSAGRIDEIFADTLS